MENTQFYVFLFCCCIANRFFLMGQKNCKNWRKKIFVVDVFNTTKYMVALKIALFVYWLEEKRISEGELLLILLSAYW